jgi:hypothetical protein
MFMPSSNELDSSALSHLFFISTTFYNKLT